MRGNESREGKSKYRRLLGDTVIFAIGNLGSKVILFFMVPLYTHFLTEAEYGIADLVFTASQLVVPFVSLVIFDAVIRFGLAKDVEPDSVLRASFFVLFIGSAITAAATPLLRFYETLRPWKWYLFAYVVLTMFGSVELNYLKVKNQNKAYAAISIIHTAVLAGANVLFLTALHWGIRGYLLSTLLSSASTVVLALFFGRIISAYRHSVLDKKLLREMAAFSAPLIFNNVSWWLIQSSDKFMVEALVSAAALGLYTAATKIPSLINVIISIFSQAWGISAVSEYESTNDAGFYSEVFTAYSAVVFGAAVCINAVVKPFISIYLSETFYEAWRFVPLLLTSAAFSAVANYFGSLYGALKRSVNNMKSTLFAAIINVLVNYAFIVRIGAMGAVIGTVVSYLFLALYRMLDVLRFIKFDPKWSVFLANLLLLLAQAVLITLDFHVFAVAVASVLLCAIINRRTVLRLMKTLKTLLKKPPAALGGETGRK